MRLLTISPQRNPTRDAGMKIGIEWTETAAADIMHLLEPMHRSFQILLIISFVAFSWLAFMVVHEFGHALTAWLTGGSVALMVLHPLQISWTAFSRNPCPQL